VRVVVISPYPLPSGPKTFGSRRGKGEEGECSFHTKLGNLEIKIVVVSGVSETLQIGAQEEP
jgi:hypothetical protein